MRAAVHYELRDVDEATAVHTTVGTFPTATAANKAGRAINKVDHHHAQVRRVSVRP